MGQIISDLFQQNLGNDFLELAVDAVVFYMSDIIAVFNYQREIFLSLQLLT